MHAGEVIPLSLLLTFGLFYDNDIVIYVASNNDI